MAVNREEIPRLKIVEQTMILKFSSSFNFNRTYALGFDRKIKELVTPIGGLDKPGMELERA